MNVLKFNILFLLLTSCGQPPQPAHSVGDSYVVNIPGCSPNAYVVGYTRYPDYRYTYDVLVLCSDNTYQIVTYSS